jgi:hypothetical protein
MIHGGFSYILYPSRSRGFSASPQAACGFKYARYTLAGKSFLGINSSSQTLVFYPPQNAIHE